MDGSQRKPTSIDESIHLNNLTGDSLHGISPMNNKSVRFANNDDASPTVAGVSPGRVRELKQKLQDSFRGDASLQRSWGGSFNTNNLAAAMRSSGNDLSDSYSEDDFDDSFGVDGNVMRSMMPSMDDSENLRAKARRGSVSFNMSFVNIGAEMDDLSAKVNRKLMGSSSSRYNSDSMATSGRMSSSGRTRASGRGSIFVIADEKFAQTRVVQARLEKAARKIQRFLRQSMLVLAKYNKERIYLEGELEDTENRRREELSDVAAWIKEEQEQFKMEMEQKYHVDEIPQEQWDAYKKEEKDLKLQVLQLRTDNKEIKKLGRDLIHKNEQLELDINDKERESERGPLEQAVKKLENDIEDWERIQSRYQGYIEEVNAKIEILTERRKTKRGDRKKIEKCIKKIVQMLEKNVDENPKLLAKVVKLKTKREQKMQLLKEQTVSGLWVVEDDYHFQQLEQKLNEQEIASHQRKQRISVKREAKYSEDDVPELENMDWKKNEETKQLMPVEKVSTDPPKNEASPDSPVTPKKKDKHKKKLKDVVLHVMDDCKKDEERPEDKKKGKKQKSKMLKSMVDTLKSQREKADGDQTLMMIYAAEQLKKQEEAEKQAELEKQARVEKNASALMSLITS